MARNDQIARILTLAHALTSTQRGIVVARFAEEHGWKVRAVYRDIEALTKAGFPITPDDGRYKLDKDFAPPPHAGIDADEALALSLARQLLGQWKETTLGRAMDRLWTKLVPSPASARRDSSTWLSVRTGTGIDYERHRKTIALLERCVRERRVVSCRYRALSTAEESSRDLEPCELHWDPSLESMYLIAWCRLRGDVRVFAVHRFVEAVATEESFEPRAGVTSQDALRHAFRVWRSKSVETIRVRFSGEIAPEIRERTWFPSQTVVAEADGSLILTAEVAGLAEVTRWVLGFGPDARPLGPQVLVDIVRERLAAALLGIDSGG